MNGHDLYIDHGEKVIVAYFGPALVAVLTAQTAPTVSLLAFAVSGLVMLALVSVDVYDTIA